MLKIRHVAIASSDPAKLSEFYKKAFGMKQVQGMGGAIYLSDGSINLALNKTYIGARSGHLPFRRRSRGYRNSEEKAKGRRGQQ